MTASAVSADPGSPRVAPALAAACAAGLPAAALVLVSGWGLKWALAVVFGVCAVAAAVVIPDRRRLGLALAAAAVPIGIQYRLLTHGNRYFLLQHFGGAPAEPVVNLADLALLDLALVYGASVALRRLPAPRLGRFDALVGVFLFICALSAYATNEPALLAYELLRYLKFYLFFVVLRACLGSARSLRTVTTALLAVASLQGGLAAAQYFAGLQLPLPVGGVAEASYDLFGGELIQRVTGLVGHSNTFSAYLVCMIALALAVLAARVPARARLAVLPALALAGLGLVLTFSRNGFLTAALCGVLVTALALRSGRLPMMTVPAALCAALLAAILVAGFGAGHTLFAGGAPPGAAGITGLADTVRTRLLYDPGKAIESRWDLLVLAANMVRRHPFLGIGLNSFEENMAAYDRSGTVNVIPQPVHNAYVLTAAEIGIAGAVVFVVIGLWLVRASWRLLSRGDEAAWVAGTFGLCTFVSLGVSNLFDLTLRKEPIVALVTLTAALVLAMEGRPDDGRAEDRRH